MSKFKKLLFILLPISLVIIFINNKNISAEEVIPPVKISQETVKQGNYFYITGLKQDKYYLDSCKAQFANKKYNFYKQVTDSQVYFDSKNKKGYEYIARIATTPLIPAGVYTVILNCAGKEYKLQTVAVQKEEFTLQHIKLSSSKNSLKTTELEVSSVRKALRTKSPYALWDKAKPWTLPSTYKYSSSYGLRRTYNGVLAKNYYHKGTDFASPHGSDVIAPANGKVLLTGHEKDGFNINGNIIILDHGQGITSAYLHLSAINVKEGDYIEAGQKIGAVGHTGVSTAPHLHYGLYLEGVNINPVPFFSSPLI